MVELKISDEIIINVDESLDDPMFLPLLDVDEHKNYFCWTLESAIMTRIYYKEYKTLPSGDMIYAGILDYLGVKHARPGERDMRPCFHLTIKMDD